MFEWNASCKIAVSSLLIALLVWLPASAHAAPIVCMLDSNANSSFEEGEYQTCTATAQGNRCPINAVACTTNAAGADVCPLGGSNVCMDDGAGGKSCSAVACVDQAATQTTEQPANLNSYQNDGEKDSSGNCLGASMIFSGNADVCHPAGTSTGWKSCCANDQKIYQDSTGASVEEFLTNKAIVVAAKAGYAAVSAYASAISEGSTAAQATEAGSAAAQNEVLIAFDPTSLVIAIIIYLVMSYLMKACPVDDMTTALLNDSGYCHLLGEHCVAKMFGSCSQSERVFCCFNSKLARIIQEQGRAQIPGMNDWGTPEAPNCRGFTPTEFQALDFSRIDLSEYYADLRRQTDAAMKANIEAGINDFKQKSN